LLLRTLKALEVETYTRGDRVDLRSVELGLPIETIYEDVIGAIGQ
jgi:hypothetical protein